MSLREDYQREGRQENWKQGEKLMRELAAHVNAAVERSLRRKTRKSFITRITQSLKALLSREVLT